MTGKKKTPSANINKNAESKNRRLRERFSTNVRVEFFEFWLGMKTPQILGGGV